jgi:hypothetical protein
MASFCASLTNSGSKSVACNPLVSASSATRAAGITKCPESVARATAARTNKHGSTGTALGASAEAKARVFWFRRVREHRTPSGFFHARCRVVVVGYDGVHAALATAIMDICAGVTRALHARARTRTGRARQRVACALWNGRAFRNCRENSFRFAVPDSPHRLGAAPAASRRFARASASGPVRVWGQSWNTRVVRCLAPWCWRRVAFVA